MEALLGAAIDGFLILGSLLTFGSNALVLFSFGIFY